MNVSTTLMLMAISLSEPSTQPTQEQDRADLFIRRALDAFYTNVAAKHKAPLREKRDRLAEYERAVFSPKRPGKPESWIDPDTKERVFKGGPDEKKRKIESLNGEIAALERQCEPTLEDILGYRPELDLYNLEKEGAFGRFPKRVMLGSIDMTLDLRVIVEQVVDENNLRGRMDLGGEELCSFWLSGLSTAGLVDAQTLSTDQMFAPSGTKQYPTAIGSVRTVHHFERFAIDPAVLAERAQRALIKERR